MPDLEPQAVVMDLMNTPENPPLSEALEVALDQRVQVFKSKTSKDEPSPTPTQDSRSSEWTLTCRSSQNCVSVETFAQSPFQFPEEILSMLIERFHDQPLPVSLDGPPSTHTLLMEKEIKWYGNCYDGWQPRWGGIEPRIEDIRKTAKPFMRYCGMDPDSFAVAPFRQGLWNKLYTITSKNKITGAVTERIFRVALPVNPWFKLQSEVATMEYVRQKTSIPIPKVYIFDSSMTSLLGFEWMIMEKVDGRTYRDAQTSMSQEMKEGLHRTVAEWVDQLSKLQFDRIGSLYREWDPRKPNHLCFRLGPVTSDHFLGPWRTQNKAFRGPFQNEAQLYRSIVELNLSDILNPRQLDPAKRAWAVKRDFVFFAAPEDGDELQEPTTVYSEAAFEPSGVQNACFTVLDLLPSIENTFANQNRSYALHHFDISEDNVLIDDTGAAVALLDWENLMTTSLSQIYPWPSIIDPTRYEHPQALPH